MIGLKNILWSYVECDNDSIVQLVEKEAGETEWKKKGGVFILMLFVSFFQAMSVSLPIVNTVVIDLQAFTWIWMWINSKSTLPTIPQHP